MINAISSYAKSIGSFKWVTFIFMLISVLGLFLPLAFIGELPEYVSHSVLADTLHHNDSIAMAYLCSICTLMPLIIDILLDVFSHDKIVNYHDRLLILVIMILPSIFYKLFINAINFPYIFICLHKSQFNALVHITISYLVESSPKSLLPTPIFYLGVILFYLSGNLLSCSLLVGAGPISVTLYIMSWISYYTTIVILILTTYRWLKYAYTWRKEFIPGNKHYNECYMCSSYLLVLWFAVATSFLVSSEPSLLLI